MCRMRKVIVILLFAVAVTTYGFRGLDVSSRSSSMRVNRGYLVCSASPEDAGRQLYECASRGNIEKLATLLDEAKGNKNILNWKAAERYGRSPLVISSYYGRLEAVKLLLATKGVDPNMGTDFGATALHFAAHRGHVDVVKVLLQDRRIKVNIPATGGKWTGSTALDVCAGMGMSGKPEIIDLIKKKGGKPGKGKS